MNNLLASGLSAKQIRDILNPAIDDFSKNIAIDYSKNYGKNFIECFIKYKSIRMACGFACRWFEKEFGDCTVKKDFMEYCQRQKLSERDKKLLNRTLNMIFILRMD